MHFISIFLTLLLTITGSIAGPTKHKPSKNSTQDISYEASQIVKYLYQLDHGVVSLDKTLQKLNSTRAFRTLPRLLLIMHKNNKLQDSVVQTIWACRKAPPLTRLESDKVISALYWMTPHMKHLIDTLIEHKPDFDRAIMHRGSVSHIIAKKLKNADAMSDLLNRELMAKLVPEYAAAAPKISGEIEAKYKELIEVYERPSIGEFTMPDMSEVSDMLRSLFKKFWARFKKAMIPRRFDKYHRHQKHRHHNYTYAPEVYPVVFDKTIVVNVTADEYSGHDMHDSQ